MSAHDHSHHDAHHGDNHAHGTLGSYMIGFGLSVILTAIPFWLVMTGVLLMFYYVPATDQAYQNMKDIEASVTFGQLMRNMHRWAARQ